MTIQWTDPSGPTSSNMTVFVHDNDGLATEILDDSVPFSVHFHWAVPSSIASILGGQFRLRAYAESIGPGSEVALMPAGPLMVGVVAGQTAYDVHLDVAAGTLEGENVSPDRSGVYKIIGVLQHINTSGAATQVCGFAEGSMIQIRTP